MVKIKWNEVAWYIFIILFSIIGGLIAYYANRKKDPGVARNYLLAGIIILVIQIITLGAGLVLPTSFFCRDIEGYSVHFIGSITVDMIPEGMSDIEYCEEDARSYNCTVGNKVYDCTVVKCEREGNDLKWKITEDTPHVTGRSCSGPATLFLRLRQ